MTENSQHPEQIDLEKSSEPIPESSPVVWNQSDVSKAKMISAMSEYVIAQHEYIQSREVIPLVAAQLRFITVATDFIGSVQPGYVAEANEMAINCMMITLRQLGAV